MYGGYSTTLDRYLFDKLIDNKITMGSSSYLSKPRLGVKSSYNVSDKDNIHGKNKKARLRKSAPKMTEYGIKKRLPDYTELAYKEAVSRLRYFLSESYVPSSRSSKLGGSIKNLDESGDEGYDVLSKSKYPLLNLYSNSRPLYSSTGNINATATAAYPSRPSILARRYPVYARDYRNYAAPETIADINTSSGAAPASDQSQTGKTEPRESELMGFIQKQEEYIEQLERESSYCRDELNNLLSKVKEVITENESLHEKQKNHLISSVMENHSGRSDSEEDDLDSDVKYSTVKAKKSPKSPRRMEGPNIVFESKISELEAQLTQSNIDLKKLQDENAEYRKRLSEGIVDSPCLDSFKRQIENLQRDKTSLESQVSRLTASLEECKDTDSDLMSKARRSADLVYQANNDKIQLEMEIRRLKEEMERQQGRIRELLAEQGRRVMDERSAVERRYCHQVEQLTNDLTTHWDSATKLQLELERQKREEGDIKRELSQKNSQIEELKLELKNKVSSLQADIAQLHADKAAVEEELANARLVLERHQRQAKHDSNRLNSEIQSVRQRLDRADADLVHSRRENLRLIDQLSMMEKEVNLKSLRPASPTKDKESIKEKELSNMIHNMETKHAQTVSELEAMVCSQNTLMEKLTAECHLLTSKLDDASQRHKQEMASLQNKLELLSARVSSQSHTAPYTQNPSPPRETIKYAPTSNGNEYANQGYNTTQSGRTSQQGNYYAQPDQRRIDSQPEQRRISRQSSRTSINNGGGSGRQSVNSLRPEDTTTTRYGNREEEFVADAGKNLNSNPPNSPISKTIDSNVSSRLTEHNVDKISKHLADSEQVESEKELANKEEDVKDEMEYGDDNVTYADDVNAYDQTYVADQQYVDPNQQYDDTNQQYDGSNQQYDVTNQQYDETNQQYDGSNQQYEESNQQYDGSNQQYDSSNQQYEDPNQQYVDPNQQYATDQQYDPNQQYADPNQQYDQQYVDPNQQYDQQQYDYSQKQ